MSMPRAGAHPDCLCLDSIQSGRRRASRTLQPCDIDAAERTPCVAPHSTEVADGIGARPNLRRRASRVVRLDEGVLRLSHPTTERGVPLPAPLLLLLFVGGAIDNPNITGKEPGMLSMEAYLSPCGCYEGPRVAGARQNRAEFRRSLDLERARAAGRGLRRASLQERRTEGWGSRHHRGCAARHELYGVSPRTPVRRERNRLAAGEFANWPRLAAAFAGTGSGCHEFPRTTGTDWPGWRNTIPPYTSSYPRSRGEDCGDKRKEFL
jgi:hypothetical protein